MKPIVIIAIAVVCSVIAVLGILILFQEVAIYQSQVALDEYQEEVFEKQVIEERRLEYIFSQNREICLQMFTTDSKMWGGTHPYDYCLEYGYQTAVDRKKVFDCRDSDYSFNKAECENKIESKLLEIKKSLDRWLKSQLFM